MAMLARLWNHLTLRTRSDSGIGMILVIGIVIFVAGITATAGVIAINGLGQSRQRIHFEQALAAAESGIDVALSQVQWAFDTKFADYPIPSPAVAPSAGCTAAAVQLPTAANDPETWDERAWADQTLDGLAADPLDDGKPACLVETSAGDVLILKPRNAEGGAGLKYGRVYARGWSPKWGDPNAVSRTIKVEYVFLPYRPQHAVLTGSSLQLQGSYLVDEANEVDANTAGVHTNGNLEIVGAGGDVSGPVTYVGTVDGSQDFTGGAPKQTDTKEYIPPVSARYLYEQAPGRGSTDPSDWIDLCPDGTARPYSEDGPCDLTMDEVDPKGWAWSSTSPPKFGSTAAPLWTANRDTKSGTYFVYGANATNGTGNQSFNSITVIAAAATETCASPRAGGNIVWDHYSVGLPYFGDLWFLADQDLLVDANFDAGSNGAEPVAGSYIAGEEVRLKTASSMLVGSVLAANQCPNELGGPADTGPVEGNDIQGQKIWFKPNSDSPFSSLISTTLWLEY